MKWGVRSSRLSYKDRRSYQRHQFRLIGFLLLVIVLFVLFSNLLLQPCVLLSRSMMPGYPEGARFLVWRPVNTAHLERGDLILFHTPYLNTFSLSRRVWGAVSRFFTLGKAGVPSDQMIKRVIALPGDSVQMNQFIAQVQSPGEEFYLTEFEMSQSAYDVQTPSLPEGWDGPLDGHADAQMLEPDEFYVLGDHRGASCDSLYWGPLESSLISGKVVFCYWPLKNFGLPR